MIPLSDAEKREFFSACESGRIGSMERVLQQCPEAVNLRNKDGWTPLMLAVQWGQTEAVQCLLSYHPDRSLTDSSDRTARDLSEQLNFESITDLFRAAAARDDILAAERAREAAVGQYSSGLESPLTLQRKTLRLRK
jgi:ankyrin repeat protein